MISEDGTFCDPQLGCSDTLLLGDLATAESTQFSQELRLSSDFDGPVNFSLGANFLRYDTEDKYYVFVNSLTLLAADWGEKDAWIPGVSDNLTCQNNLLPGDTALVYSLTECPYIDPNPIGSLNDLGHNYFLSKNPFKLISYAAFGEVYYEPLPDLEIIAGLRLTVDKKRAPRVPSQLLVSESFGYPVSEVVEQEWREPTGRLGINWKPALAFTDETLLYASYARGYKAGGANPPTPVYSIYGAGLGDTTGQEAVAQRFLSQPRTFDAEFVDAFEIGSKNTLLDGRLTLNGNVFYYDYRGYQISQIVNRSAVNLNFDAEIWGAELEADWRVLENLRFGLKVGYEQTRLADGSQAIDLMDRTAGNPDYMVIKPFPTIPSNCIVPVDWVVRSGTIGIGSNTCETLFYRGRTLDGLDPTMVPNNGEGILKDLSGNELPNAPDLTTTLTVDYTLPLPNEWLMTLHADLYRQSEAWTRVFNFDPYDRLEAFSQVNLAAIFTNDDAGWKVMAYVKNALDEDNITGAFLNSDDTGLTTNIFLNEPRLYGLRVTKEWTGGGWGGWSPGSSAEPDLSVELGGGILRADAPTDTYLPAFTSEFNESLRPVFGEGQTGDLDWGDSRQVRLVYAPKQWGWAVSLAGQTDETNGRSRSERVEEADVAGWWGPVGFENPEFCGGVSCYIEGGVYNYSRAETVHGQEHSAVDFMVGKEVGLGSSTLWAGIRYAELSSIAETSLDGRPDYYLPQMFAGFCQPSGCAHVTDYTASIVRESGFDGFGPTVQWEGATRLWSLGDGEVSLDWQAGGAVLFGEQEASVLAEITAAYYRFRIHPAAGLSTPRANGVSNLGAPTVPAGFPLEVSSRRSDHATVPNFEASIGLSYGVGALKVSTGYRWNRYFDVLDAGSAESKTYDRTFDGPYFKIAVGFGG
ncbi:MAG TPA: TonB-dependent receptor [Caulobacteraceae bacterium]|nr:TonB-dependent receptor [Caulobacteraceae bacterium]